MTSTRDKQAAEQSEILYAALNELRAIALDTSMTELWRLARIDNEIKHLTNGDSAVVFLSKRKKSEMQGE